MNISSATYQKDRFDSSENVAITTVVDGVTMTVPINTDNRHYQAILEWVADGNTIAEPA